MPEWLDAVLRYGFGAAGALSMALVTWVIAKQSRKTTTEQTAIERLRKDLETLKEESRADQAAMSKKLERTEVKLRLQSDYIHDLRDHIVQHKPPPPPKFPDGLYI